MMTVYFSDLKDYGQDVDLDIILTKYRIYFENDFSTDHVIFAIHEHCKRSKEIPRISDLMDILCPVAPKISDAQFIAAREWQKRNGYPMISDALDTIKEYEKQQSEKTKIHKIDCDKIKSIAQNSIKRISA